MMSRVTAVSIVLWAVLAPARAGEIPPVPETSYTVMDDLAYDSATARRLWTPMSQTAPVSVVQLRHGTALKMPCNFEGTTIERASWDRDIDLDMAFARGMRFLYYCPNAQPIASFSLYFRSGNGWYRGHFPVTSTTDWVPVEILKEDMGIEGQPAGWSQVDRIRISAWRGGDVDTEFYIASLGIFGNDAETVIVRNNAVAETAPSELSAVEQYTEVMAQFLDRTGLPYTVVSDADVTAERLKDTKLLIFPHNPAMPTTAVSEIKTFIEAGGKLLACYGLPSGLESTVGIDRGQHLRQERSGYFSSIVPSEHPLDRMPESIEQASWNINEAAPIDGRSRIAAWWHSDDGLSTGKAAIVASDTAVFLTHVLLPDDPDNKLYLLLSMIGHLVPDLWSEAATGRIQRIGHFGPYEDYDSACQGIRQLAPDSNEVEAALESAGEVRIEAMFLLAERKFSEAIVAAERAQQTLTEAYCLAQQPVAGEHRAFWCHSAFGVDGLDWDTAIERLADNGFTAILPNMLWGGVAFYGSDVLPVSPAVQERGDQIALCLAACKSHGVECHVWKVNFNMGWATDETFVNQMKEAERTQVSFDGASNDRWLCPSHPENQILEIESMVEVARKYDVDGLHFDYIRYPGNDNCFCDGCRARFEAAIGKTVMNWPADVRNDEELVQQWQDFRRLQITTVVAAVSERARQVRPGIEISAAVFPNWTVHRDTVAQDWKLWCEKAYLDFVCPMDYTPSASQFRHQVELQLPWAGSVPCYPGIGLTTWDDPTDICSLIEQITVTRQLQTGGFTIFNYGAVESGEVIPLLGRGMTRDR